MVWSPLAGGFLSGKYTRANPKGDAGARLASFEFLPYDRERAYDLIDLLQSIGKKHDAVPAQISLAWLLTRPAISALLVGAASVKQLEANLGAADVTLDADDLAKLDAATRPTATYPNWFTARVADGKAHEALGIPLAAPLVRS
jgi:aryl-alcohol dehydrogenase-like predicted oxidoreductase